MATTTYRGLTIRIGGDVSSLQKALSQVNKSITFTAGEVKKLSAAMKLDPTNVAAYGMQLGHMSNQAVNTARKLAVLRDTASQIGSKKFMDVSGVETSVEELARTAGAFGDNIQNAAGNLATARSQADALLNNITKMHRDATSLTKEASKIAKMQVSSAFSLALDTKSDKQVEKQIDAFADRMGLTAERTQRLKSDISNLRTEIESTFSQTFANDDERNSAIAKLVSMIKKEIPEGVKYAESSLGNLVKKTIDMGKALEQAKKAIRNDKTGQDEGVLAASSSMEQAKKDLDDYKTSSEDTIATIERDLQKLRDKSAELMVERTEREQKALDAESGKLAEIADIRNRVDEEHASNIAELSSKREESMAIERRAMELMELAYSNDFVNMKKASDERQKEIKAEKARLKSEIGDLKEQAGALKETLDGLKLKIDVEDDEAEKLKLKSMIDEVQSRYDALQETIKTKYSSFRSYAATGGNETKRQKERVKKETIEENKALSKELADEYDELVEKIHNDTIKLLDRPFDGTEESVRSLQRAIEDIGTTIDKTRENAQGLKETLTEKGYSEAQIQDPRFIEDKQDRHLASTRITELNAANDMLLRQQKLVSELNELFLIEGQLAANADIARRKAATDAAIAEREGLVDGEKYIREHFGTLREEASKPVQINVTSDAENETRSLQELRDELAITTEARKRDVAQIDKSRDEAYKAYIAQKENSEKLRKQLEKDADTARKKAKVLPNSRYVEVERAEKETERLKEIWQTRLAQEYEIVKDGTAKEAALKASIAAVEKREADEAAEAERAAAEQRAQAARESIARIENELRSFEGFSDVIDLSDFIDIESIDKKVDEARNVLDGYMSEVNEVEEKLRKLGVSGFESPDFDETKLSGEAAEVYGRYIELINAIDDVNHDIDVVNDKTNELSMAQLELADATRHAVKTPMQQILDDYHEATDNIVIVADDTATRIAESYGSVDDRVRPALNNVAESLKEVRKAALSLGEDGKDSEFMSGLVENAKSSVEELKDVAEGYVKVLSDMGVDISDEAFDSEKLEGSAKLIYERYLEVGDAIRSAEGNLSEMSDAVDNLRQKEEALADKQKENADKTIESIDDETESIMSAKEAQDKFNDAIRRGAELREKYDQSKHNTEDVIENSRININFDRDDRISQWLYDLQQGISVSIKWDHKDETIEKSLNEISRLLGDSFDWSEILDATGFKSVTELFNVLTDDVDDTVDRLEIVEKMFSALEKSSDEVGDAVENTLLNALAEQQGVLSELAVATSDATDALLVMSKIDTGKTTDELKDMKTVISDIGSFIVNEIPNIDHYLDRISDNFPEYSDFFKELKRRIEELDISNVFKQYYDDIDKLFDFMSELENEGNYWSKISYGKLEGFGDYTEEMERLYDTDDSWLREMYDRRVELNKIYSSMLDAWFDYGKRADKALEDGDEQLASNLREYRKTLSDGMDEVREELLKSTMNLDVFGGSLSELVEAENVLERIVDARKKYERVYLAEGKYAYSHYAEDEKDPFESIAKAEREAMKVAGKAWNEYLTRIRENLSELLDIAIKNGDSAAEATLRSAIESVDNQIKAMKNRFRNATNALKVEADKIKSGAGEVEHSFTHKGEEITVSNQMIERYYDLLDVLKRVNEHRKFQTKLIDDVKKHLSSGIITEEEYADEVEKARAAIQELDSEAANAEKELSALESMFESDSKLVKIFGKNLAGSFRDTIELMREARQNADDLNASLSNGYDAKKKLLSNLTDSSLDLNSFTEDDYISDIGIGSRVAEIKVNIDDKEARQEIEAVSNEVDEASSSVSRLAEETNEVTSSFTQLSESGNEIRESLQEEVRQQQEAAEAARMTAQAQDEVRESIDETVESARELNEQGARDFTDEQRKRIDEVKSGMVSQDTLDEENRIYGESIRILEEREAAIRSNATADEEMAQRERENAEEINRKEEELAKARQERRERIAVLEQKYNTAVDEYRKSKGQSRRAAAEARETIKQIKDVMQSEVKSLNESFGFEIFSDKNGNTDPTYIAQAMDKVISYLDKGDAASELFRGNLAKLVDDYNMAVSDIEKWDLVARFQDLTAEIEKTDASIMNLSDSINNMHSPDELLAGMVVLDANLKELDDAYKSIASTQKSLSDVVGTDPDSVVAISLAMNALSESERLVSEQIDIIQEKIDKFDVSEIDQFTDVTKSARQQLFDASQNATQAQKAYASAKGELDYLLEKQSKLRNQLAVLNSEIEMSDFEPPSFEGMSDSQIAEIREANKEYYSMVDLIEKCEADLSYVDGRVTSVSGNIESLRERSEEASKALSMAKQREKLEELQAQLVIIRNEYDQLIGKSREFASMLAESTGRTFFANIFGESVNATDGMESTFDALVKRAETFAEATKTFPRDFDIAKKSVASIDEAIASGVALATELRNRMTSIVPDEGMRSYDQIRDEYGSIGEAARKATNDVEYFSFMQQQTMERIRAAKSAGNETLVGHLTEELGVYEEKLHNAQELARNVSLFTGLEEDEARLIAINTQLDKLYSMRDSYSSKRNTEVAKTVDDYMKTMRESFGSNILSGFKQEFDALTKSIEESKKRIAKIDKEMEYTPEGKGSDSLTRKRYEENARLIELVNRRTTMYQETLERLGGVDAFDNLNEDILRLGASLSSTKTEFENTLNGIRKISNDLGFGDDFIENIRKRALDHTLSDDAYSSMMFDGLFDGLVESIPDDVLIRLIELGDKLRELGQQDYDLTESLGIKYVLKELSQLQDKAEETGGTISRSLGQKPIKFDDVVKSAESYVDSMRKMFGDMFSNGIGEQLGDLTSRLERAKERVKEIDAEIEANGSNESLSKQRVDAIAEAVSIADQRTKLFNDTLEQLGGESALDGLATRIRTTAEEFTGIRVQIESVRKQLVDMANVRGLDKNWVDRVMNAGLNNAPIKDVDESVQDLILRLMELSEAQAKVGQSLSFDMMLDALSKYRVKAAETAEGIQNDFKKSTKVQLDDSASKALKKLADSMKDGFKDTGVDDAVRDMGYYGDVVEENSKRLERMKNLLKENPTNEMFKTDTLKAADAYIDALTKKIENAKKALDNWNTDDETLFDVDAFNAGTAAAEYERAKKSMEDWTEKVKELEQKLKEAKEAKEKLGAAQDTSAAEKSINDIEQELNEAKSAADEAAAAMRKFGNTAEYAKIDAEVRVDTNELNNAKKSRKTEFADVLSESYSSMSSAFEQAIDRMADFAERAGQKIVESAEAIDSAYRDMRKTVDGTESQFKELHDAAVAFSQTNAISADTLLSMESLGGQLGVAVENLQSFGEVAANLDIATDIDAETIALQLGQMSNIMNDLDDTTFVNMADALVRLGNNTATTESKIMAVAERMAAIANVTSMSTPELMAWSAAIASTGQRSESAATAINNSITGIGQAVAEGGATLEQFAKIAGMSADEFSEKWRSSSSEALEAFVKGLGNLTDDSTAAIAALDSVGISSVRQETALLALSQTIDNLDKSLMLAEEGFNNGGDAAREAEQKSKGFSGSLAILRNNVTDLAESMGDGLLPFIQGASVMLKLITDLLNMLPGPFKTVMVGVTGTAAVLGVTLPLIKDFVVGWADMIKNGGPLKVMLNSITTAIEASNGAMEANATANGKAAATAKAATAATDGQAAANEGAAAASAMNTTANEANSTSNTQVATTAGEASVAEAGLAKSEDGAAASAGKATTSNMGLAASNTAVKETSKAGGAALGSAAAGATSLGGALGAMVPHIAAVIAVLVALSFIMEKVTDIMEHNEKVADAMRDFDDAVSSSSAAVAELKGQLDSLPKSAKNTKDEFDAFLQQQSQFQDSLAGMMSGLSSESTELEHYAGLMEALGGKCNGSKAKFELLKEAVDGFNKIAGTSIEVVDEKTGKLTVLSGTLKKVIEDYEEFAKQKAYIDMWQTSNDAVNKAELELEKIEMQISEAQDKLKEGLDGSPFDSSYMKTVSVLRELNGQREEASKILEKNKSDEEAYRKLMEQAGITIEGVGEDIEKNETTTADYAETLSVAGDSLDAFNSLTDEQKKKINEIQAALHENGSSITDYGSLTKDELEKLADAWNTNVDDIVAKLKELKQARDESASGKPSDQELEAYKRENEKLYEQEKRLRDDFYDQDKRLRDIYYEGRKNDLDDEYEYEKRVRDDALDDRKKELDEEYEYEKQLRDKKYEERKQELDDEYEIEKRYRDELYDQAKQAYDDMYTEEKRIRDKAYDDKKDELDRWLDDYKDELDEEVDAFEKATDERLKLMEEEYEQKKKLIEADEKKDTADIDARIKAIKDQTAAEEKAAKLREREEKIAEATAKRDKYSEGSKAYEKYDLELQNLKTEYANEDEKERRDEYIEYLEGMKDKVKENADERQDVLKDSYDREKEEYKTRRDEEKEALKKHNSDLVEIQKAANDQELESLKIANENELTEIKRRHEAELQVFKYSLDDELTGIKRKNEIKLTNLKNANDAELADIKFKLDKEAEDYKRANEDELTEIKRGQEAHLELLKYYHEQELLGLKRHHDDELTEIKNRIDDENEAYKNGGITALKALKDTQNALKNTQTAAEGTSAAIETAASKSSTAIELHMSNLVGSVQNKLTNLSAWLSSDDPALVTAAQSLVTSSSDELWKLVEKAHEIGFEVPANISSALVANEGVTSESVRSLVEGISGPISSISGSARTDIESTMAAISETLTSKTPETVSSANQFVSDMSDELWTLVTKADELGIEVPDTLVESLLKNSEPPKEAAHLLAKGVGDALGDSVSKDHIKTGTWQLREELGLNFSSENSKGIGVPFARGTVEGVSNTLSSDDSKKQVGGGATSLMNVLNKDLSPEKGSEIGAPLGKNVVSSASKSLLDEASSEETKNRMGKFTGIMAKNIASDDTSMNVVGNNSAAGFYNGFVDYVNKYIIPGVRNLAKSIAGVFKDEHEIASPSKLFAWFAEMDALGYAKQWDRSSGDMLNAVSNTSEDIADAFDVDFSDTDVVKQMVERMAENQNLVVEQTKSMMDNIVDTMRERESLLQAQAERMAKIMEDGFDPTLSAAFEAIDTIDTGKLRRSQAIAASQSVNNVTNAPVVNISCNFEGVSMRDDRDIDRISAEFERRMRRILSAQIG